MDYQTLKLTFPNIKILQNHPLASYTTVKIGGPADIFVHPKTTDEFKSVLKYLSSNPSGPPNGGPPPLDKGGTKVNILGNGSNILISDSGIRGIVIKNSADNIEILPNNQIKVDSGVMLPLLLQKTTDLHLSGLEEFAYIPSSLGGAVVCNIHGTDKNNFDKYILSVDVFDLSYGTVLNRSLQSLTWNYDFSEFQHHPEWIVLSATLQLQPGNSVESKQKINDIITKKSQTQSINSLGCVFKNLPAVAGRPADSAGRIIDQELGLKGFQIGNIQISPLHANFFINLGSGTAADYLALIKKVQSLAKSKLNITLKPEIKFLGEF